MSEEKAVIVGNYADIKTVKTRSVFQVIVEIPIEEMRRFLELFGGPIPSQEMPVVLARLGEGIPLQSKPPKVHKRLSERPHAQQVAVLCHDLLFRNFLLAYGSVRNPEEAEETVKKICGVGSKTELDTDPASSEFWVRLRTEYEQWKGSSID
jgi:hypothetical protein